MGVMGAALASLVSRAVACCAVLFLRPEEGRACVIQADEMCIRDRLCSASFESWGSLRAAFSAFWRAISALSLIHI